MYLLEEKVQIIILCFLCSGRYGLPLWLLCGNGISVLASGKCDRSCGKAVCVTCTQNDYDPYRNADFVFIHFLNVVILLLYLRYVLRMEFQGSMAQMLLVSLVGCIVGVSMGVFVSSASKLSENIKVAIMLGISMTGSTLAGLMNSKIKFAVDQNMPIINKLNPAALITDAFYCINVYDDPVRMKTNLMTLLLMAVVLTAGSFW